MITLITFEINLKMYIIDLDYRKNFRKYIFESIC